MDTCTVMDIVAISGYITLNLLHQTYFHKGDGSEAPGDECEADREMAAVAVYCKRRVRVRL